MERGTGTDGETTRVVSKDWSVTREAGDREPAIETGATLGRYVVRSIAGSGGMGQVYRAFDPELGREVALKVLDRLRHSRSDTSPLIREAQAMARLSHPNVVPVYAVETFDQRVFLVMEFVEGQTLRGWLREAERGADEILAAFTEAGQGLAAAHAAGIVHRDFKPANVLVGRDGAIRVTDFGIAHTEQNRDDWVSSVVHGSVSRDDEPSDSKTRVSLVMGTPAYMSPEQHDGRTVDARSDQYSFCVTLYEALHGRRPFDGETAEQIAERKRAGLPNAVPPPGVPVRVGHAIRRGMSVEPRDRFESMDALLDELRPRRKNRAPWVAGVAALGLGTALTVIFTRADPCDEAAERIAEVWGDAQRQTIAGAMQASEVAFAADGTTKIHQALDQVTAEWTREWTRACRMPAADAGRDRAMDCLARQHRELGAMVTALEQLDADSAAEAISAAWSLPEPSQCSREGESDEGSAPEEIAERVEEIREALGRGRALDRLGKAPEAFEIVQALLADAERLGFAPLQAEVELELGTLAIRHGDLDAAKLLEASYFRAMEAEAHYTAAMAAAELVYVWGYQKADVERAFTWERHARSAVRLAGSPSDAVARLFNTSCTARLAAGQYDQARRECLQAIEIHESTKGPDHPSLLAPLNNLAKIELDLRRPQAAAPHAERSQDIAQRSYGPLHPWTITTLNLQGAVAGYDGRDDEALDYFEEALDRTRKATPHDTESIAGALQNIATTHAAARRYDRAEEILREAIELLARERGSDHVSIGIIHDVLGRVLNDKGDIDGAREQMDRALALMIPYLGEDHPEVARARYEAGRIAYAQERFDDAMEVFQRLSQRDPGSVPASTHANTITWIGLIHIQQENLEPVAALLDRAHAVPDSGDAAQFLASTRFELAKALADAHEDGTPGAAVDQARLALTELDRVPPGDERQGLQDTITEWLGEHREERG